ncbi:hypothetical protein [Flavobacterium sp.]
METPILIIGFILIAMFVAPIYLIIKNHKIDDKKVQTIFTAHNQNNKFNFAVQLTDKKKVLGVDAQKRGLLYIDFNQTEPYVQFVNLEEQQNCTLVTATEPGNTSRFKKLSFHFDGKSNSKSKEEITFYDHDQHYTIPVYPQEEYIIAQKWHEVIRSL